MCCEVHHCKRTKGEAKLAHSSTGNCVSNRRSASLRMWDMHRMFDNLINEKPQTTVTLETRNGANAFSQTHEGPNLPMVALSIGVRRYRGSESIVCTNAHKISLVTILLRLFVLERQRTIAAIRKVFSSPVHSKSDFSKLGKHSTFAIKPLFAIASLSTAAIRVTH
jgi:hypothetical protein